MKDDFEGQIIKEFVKIESKKLQLLNRYQQ